jgi:hypothetical protein
LLFSGINLVFTGPSVSSNNTSTINSSSISISGNNQANTVQGTSATWAISITSSSTVAIRYFRPTVSGVYEIYTLGNYDTIGSLYNNSTNALIATNDDSGSSYNFLIRTNLSSTVTYRIVVTLYSGTGNFNLYVRQ